jgi:hypothetical protein
MFDEEEHKMPVQLRLGPHNKGEVLINGPNCTDQMRLSTLDNQEATEYGACGVIAQLTEEMHSLVILARSPKDGKHFDYYLWPTGSTVEEENLTKAQWLNYALENSTCRLEVSGMATDNDEASDRLWEKRKLFPEKSDARPVLIGIVDFRRRVVRLEKLDRPG